METAKTAYERLANINVGDHIEKKNNLSYLSWAWAVDQLMRQDAAASWEYKEPVKWGDTVMVFCTVTAFGKSMTAQLPVMDYKNKAIPNPDAFAVNTAMQRCLAKAIALHGLGLYIYAGEDLPLSEAEAVATAKDSPKPAPKQNKLSEKEFGEHMDAMGAAGSMDALKTAFGNAWNIAEGDVMARSNFRANYNALKAKFEVTK